MKKIAIAILDTHPGKRMCQRALELALRIPGASAVYSFADRPIVSGEIFIPIRPIDSLHAYSELVLYTLPRVVAEDHVMIVQWDGMPHAPRNWNPAFLDCDYIGAPWEHLPETRAVGNGGFCLRSRRFLDATLKLPLQRHYDMDGAKSEDMVLCQHFRTALESLGVSFATRALARTFSFEHGQPGEHLGFHGVRNLPLFLPEQDLLQDVPELLQRCWNRPVLAQLLVAISQRNYQDLYRALTMEIVGHDLHAQIAQIFVQGGLRMPLYTQ